MLLVVMPFMIVVVMLAGAGIFEEFTSRAIGHVYVELDALLFLVVGEGQDDRDEFSFREFLLRKEGGRFRAKEP